MLVLFYELKNYQKIIEDSSKFLEGLESKHRPLFHYFLAKSYMHKKDFLKAGEELKKYIKKEDTKNSIAALLLLLKCGDELENEELFNYVIKYFSAYYPNDEKLAEALFVRGDYYKKNHKHRISTQNTYVNIC